MLQAPIVPSKSNPESILKYVERVYATISRCGVHGHFPICHEGKSGQTGCRLSYEQPLQQCTDVCQLDAGLTPPENIQSATDHAPSTCMGCGPTRLEKDYSLQPLPTPDRRIFFWQNKRATLQSVLVTIEDPQPICASLKQSKMTLMCSYLLVPMNRCNFGTF